MKKNKIKSGDIVEIITGSFFGKTSKVVRFNKVNNSVYLEDIFREKFFKKNNKASYDKKSKETNSVEQKSKKKKILIPINISNVKKVHNNDSDI